VKAAEANLLKFLKKSDQLDIPIYQRTYSWTREQSDQLWSDILRASGDGVGVHFVGSIGSSPANSPVLPTDAP
jgi:uncharacterized protein with ParB-like and HNH nuclease domain